MTFFSIIIPVYNVESYLERCIDSILADSCKDMELILVDDGSTDSSGDICDRIAKENSCIKVIHKPNGGLSSARNAGLRIASGKWVSFIDSDDWVDLNSYQITKSILSKTENETVDIVKMGYKKVQGDQVTMFIPSIEPGIYEGSDVKEKILRPALGNRQISNSSINTVVLSSWAHIYNRDFLAGTGVEFVSEREVGSEDFLFIYSLYMRASRVLVTELRWYNYDTREGSLTCRYRNKLYAQYQKLGECVFRQLVETGIYSEFKEDYESMYLALIYMCIINECNSSENRLEQIHASRRVLDDNKLQAYLKSYHTNDKKSFMISKMMKLKAALPLCVIQWRRTRRPSR